MTAPMVLLVHHEPIDEGSVIQVEMRVGNVDEARDTFWPVQRFRLPAQEWVTFRRHLLAESGCIELSTGDLEWTCENPIATERQVAEDSTHE